MEMEVCRPPESTWGYSEQGTQVEVCHVTNVLLGCTIQETASFSILAFILIQINILKDAQLGGSWISERIYCQYSFLSIFKNYLYTPSYFWKLVE